MKFKIGTRASKLALAQTQMIRTALEQRPTPPTVEVCEISTRGDRRQGTADAQIPDKKKWVIDIERALLDGEIDCAVHSGKDIPHDIEPGTMIWPALERGAPQDVFIGARRGGTGARMQFADLDQGAVVGTASVRRAAQLLRLRPDLKVVEHRGNVPTRIEKLDQSTELSGIVLARAGLERLNLAGEISSVFDSNEVVPAVNQGMLVVQFREDDERAMEVLEDLVLIPSLAEWQAERAAVEILGADCHSAVGLYASSDGIRVSMIGRVLSASGAEAVEAEGASDVADAHQLGLKIAQELLDQGAEKLIAASRACS
ncbi:MAG: hydroxymethylbilane synthase [Bdellovibrionales bacterium]|nr:hydroxymethylbilane synthase [Bdellovibrionales bacterium]